MCCVSGRLPRTATACTRSKRRSIRRLCTASGKTACGAVCTIAATRSEPADRSAVTQPVVLSGGTLIDGKGGPPLEDACLILEGRDIVAVGRRADLGVPDAARVYDLAGKTVLPGLIDAHVHLRAYAGTERSDFYLWGQATFLEEQVLHAAANARRALAAGVTTLR